jgi:hypothetical protein
MRNSSIVSTQNVSIGLSPPQHGPEDVVFSPSFILAAEHFGSPNLTAAIALKVVEGMCCESSYV